MLPLFLKYLTKAGAGQFDQHQFQTEKDLYVSSMSASVVTTKGSQMHIKLGSTCLLTKFGKVTMINFVI